MYLFVFQFHQVFNSSMCLLEFDYWTFPDSFWICVVGSSSFLHFNNSVVLQDFFTWTFRCYHLDSRGVSFGGSTYLQTKILILLSLFVFHYFHCINSVSMWYLIFYLNWICAIILLDWYLNCGLPTLFGDWFWWNTLRLDCHSSSLSLLLNHLFI